MAIPPTNELDFTKMLVSVNGVECGAFTSLDVVCAEQDPADTVCWTSPDVSDATFALSASAVIDALDDLFEPVVVSPFPVLTRPSTRCVAGVGTFRGHFTGQEDDDTWVCSGEIYDITPYPCEATHAPECTLPEHEE